MLTEVTLVLPKYNNKNINISYNNVDNIIYSNIKLFILYNFLFIKLYTIIMQYIAILCNSLPEMYFVFSIFIK